MSRAYLFYCPSLLVHVENRDGASSKVGNVYTIAFGVPREAYVARGASRMNGRAGTLFERAIWLNFIAMDSAGRFVLEAGRHNDSFPTWAELDLGRAVSRGKTDLRI